MFISFTFNPNINLALNLNTRNSLNNNTSISLNDNEREYGLHDKVGVNLNGSPMTVVNWTEEWWKWLLGLEEKDSPFVPTSPHLNTNDRLRAHQPNEIQSNSMTKTNQSVWFLAAPPYGIEGSTVRVKIPSNWSILASPYNMFASPEYYPHSPSMTEVMKKDLDGVYEMNAILDGERLVGCTVKSDTVFTAHLPVKNIFDTKPGVHHVMAHGHWVFLKPPPEGDHWLHMSGHSKTYHLDLKLHLQVHS